MSARLRTVDDGQIVFGAVIEIEAANIRPRRLEQVTTGSLSGLAGDSRAWQRMSELAARYAATDLPILVLGERGVGKMSVIDAVFGGPRGDGVAVVDAAMETTDGAASWLATVRCHLQGPGVLVIRHIETLSDRAALGLGGILDARTASSDGRVVGTWTIGGDPRPAVRALIERLAVARVEVPPLRQRREDLPALLDSLWRRRADGRPSPRWNQDVMHALARYDWPGNVRELDGTVRRIAACMTGPEVHLTDLPDEIRRQPLRAGLSRLEQLEAAAIRDALEAHDGNKHRAAHELGISRSTLYRKLEALAPGLV